MNEFIVWYSNNDIKFSKEFTLDELIEQKHLDVICDSSLLKDYKIDCVVPCIGKKDTNNKKIYADCSIVEFDFVEHTCVADRYTAKTKGVFTFNDDTLRYEIDILDIDCKNYKDKHKFVCLNYLPERMSNFKIIGTIQENKLGLIK